MSKGTSVSCGNAKNMRQTSRTPPTLDSRAGGTFRAAQLPNQHRDTQTRASQQIRSRNNPPSPPVNYILTTPRHHINPHSTFNFSPRSRAAPVLPVQLGLPHVRPMDPSNDNGIQVGIPHQRKPLHPMPLRGTTQNLVSEEIRTLRAKKAVLQVQPETGQFLSRLFLVPKKDGSQRPVINLKPLNQFIQKQKFRSETDSGPASEEGLDDLDRPERRVPVCSNIPTTQEVSQVSMERFSVRVPVPTVRIDQSLYQAPQTSYGPPTTERDPLYNLPGRYASHGTVQGRVTETDPGHTHAFPTLGVSNQLGQISACSHPDDRKPGSSDKLCFNDNITTRYLKRRS